MPTVAKKRYAEERSKTRKFQIRMQRWFPRNSQYDLIVDNYLPMDKAQDRCLIMNKKARKDLEEKKIPLLRYYACEVNTEGKMIDILEDIIEKRLCPLCNETKPIDMFYKDRETGKVSYCRKCCDKPQEETIKKFENHGIEYKKCPSCKFIKSMESFNKNIRTADGHACYCKDCERKKKKEYRSKVKEI